MVLPDVSLVLQGFSTHGGYVTSFQNQNLRTGLRWMAKRIRKSIVAIDLECVSQLALDQKRRKTCVDLRENLRLTKGNAAKLNANRLTWVDLSQLTSPFGQGSIIHLSIFCMHTRVRRVRGKNNQSIEL